LVGWISLFAEAHGREGPSEEDGVSAADREPPAVFLYHAMAMPSSPSAETAMMAMEAHMEMTHRYLRGHVRRLRDLQQELEHEVESMLASQRARVNAMLALTLDLCAMLRVTDVLS
jgi:hypothetical protein